MKGENLAAEFLQEKGFEIVARNFRHKHAEIDLIAQRENWLLFIEVKTRTSTSYGKPEDFVDHNKSRNVFEAAEEYIIKEITKVYELQGASISRKHIEVIIRQMFSRKRVKFGGNTRFTPGEIVESYEFVRENNRMKETGGEPTKGETLVLGISEVSITTQSWLSAASFQNTTRVLIANAVKGGSDPLRGLKENVIIGRLIPAGTGFGEEQNKKEKTIDDQ